MPTLNTMNIFIFIFIFHHVANKDKYYLKLQYYEQIKLEFTINTDTSSGSIFYNILKQ